MATVGAGQGASKAARELKPGDESGWLAAMKAAIRDPAELLRRLNLPLSMLERIDGPVAQFPLFAPLPFVARMRAGDASDPLLRQLLPVPEESAEVAGFGSDPVEDAQFSATPGIIRKYHGRALLIATGSCAIHCRYCFRRHFPYSEAPRTLADWEAGLASLAHDDGVNELILSGGDPLTLRDARLRELVDRIGEVLPRLERLRIHTRLPVVIPERVTSDLLQLLSSQRTQVVVVLHVNHAREIDGSVREAISCLRSTSALLLNQAVLLKGINDDLNSQVELSETLVHAGVIPYYLHQLDRVAGAAHFECEESVGASLIREMAARLPGYAVPRFVRDEPGEPGKKWLV